MAKCIGRDLEALAQQALKNEEAIASILWCAEVLLGQMEEQGLHVYHALHGYDLGAQLQAAIERFRNEKE